MSFEEVQCMAAKICLHNYLVKYHNKPQDDVKMAELLQAIAEYTDIVPECHNSYKEAFDNNGNFKSFKNAEYSQKDFIQSYFIGTEEHDIDFDLFIYDETFNSMMFNIEYFITYVNHFPSESNYNCQFLLLSYLFMAKGNGTLTKNSYSAVINYIKLLKCDTKDINYCIKQLGSFIKAYDDFNKNPSIFPEY
jgi:hypothetical protein